MHKHEFTSKETLAKQLADDVAAQLNQMIDDQGKATLVVSGGGTPKPFFAALSQAKIAWSKLSILVADERWVPVTDEDSNEKLVRDVLMQGDCKPAIISLAPQEGESVEEGAARINKRLQTVVPDIVILGMGGDGHTASLFPDHPQLEAGLTSDAYCLAIIHSPKPPSERVTLTTAFLKQAAHTILHITGDDKRAVLEAAEGKQLPIASVLAQAAHEPHLYWAA